MVSKQTVVINPSGLHARPASDFVKAAKAFDSKIKIANLDLPEEDPMNAKSIISILALGIGPGCNVEITAEGDDEEEAVDSLIALIDSGFGE